MNDKSCLFCDSGFQLSKHHIIYKCFGGTDDASNLVGLCNECHGELHESSAKIQFILYRYICCLKNIEPDPLYLSSELLSSYIQQKHQLLIRIKNLKSKLNGFSKNIKQLRPTRRKKLKRLKSSLSNAENSLLQLEDKINKLDIDDKKSPE